jgi:hypothetical protein
VRPIFRLLIPVLASVMLLSGCMQRYAVKTKPEQGLAQYGKVVVVPVENDYFYKNLMKAKSPEDEANYRKALDTAAVEIQRRLIEKFNSNWKGSDPAKVLKLQLVTKSYNAGNTGLAMAVGWGVGKGHFEYEVRVWDGSKMVASCIINKGTNKGFTTLGYMSVVDSTYSFLDDNR